MSLYISRPQQNSSEAEVWHCWPASPRCFLFASGVGRHRPRGAPLHHIRPQAVGLVLDLVAPSRVARTVDCDTAGRGVDRSHENRASPMATAAMIGPHPISFRQRHNLLDCQNRAELQSWGSYSGWVIAGAVSVTVPLATDTVLSHLL